MVSVVSTDEQTFSDSSSFRLTVGQRPAAPGVSADDVSFVFGAVGRFYRAFRLFQYAEATQVSLIQLKGDDNTLAAWLFDPHGPGVQKYPDYAAHTDWAGGLYVADISKGSVISLLTDMAMRAGEGLSAAATGVAAAIHTIILSPADFRHRWAEARKLNADAAYREGETAAQRANLETFVWSGRVMRNEIEHTPEEWLYAIAVQVKAGQISERDADLMRASRDRDSERVAQLAERGAIAVALPPNAGPV